ncbi:MAG TPA: MFS transporter [Anaerolineales bacterium]|nr:MFS transporter [Anaerolineales bacterium]
MNKKHIAIAFLIVLTNAVGATAILPMLPIYAEKQFQATPLQALLVIPAYYGTQFVAAPWLGTLSDRFGRRPILIMSQVGTIGSYLLFIFAVPLGNSMGVILEMSGGLVMIYLARLMDGLTGGNVSAAEAYASDISDETSRAQALGLIGGAVGLGHILGPGLAVALSGISLIAPMMGALVLSGMTLLLTIMFLEESLPPEKRFATRSDVHKIHPLRISHPVTLVIATAFITGLYLASLLSSFSLYAERVLFPDRPAEVVVQNVSLLVTASGLIAAVSQIFLTAPLVKRWGEQRLVVIGSTLLLGSALGISSGSLGLVLASVILYALGYATSWPSLQAILTRLSSKENAGRLLGYFQSAFSLAFIVSPVLAGIILEDMGPLAIFQSGSFLMALATFLGIRLLRLSLPAAATTAANLLSAAAVSHPGRVRENSAD